jgi:hypothetical protein
LKKINYRAVKKDGESLRIINSKLLKADCDRLTRGEYRLIIERYKRKASPEQFRYLYGLVYPLSQIALNDAGYEFVNIDQIDQFWKAMFANKEVLNRETGEILKIPLSKSEFMTIDELTYCDAIRNYCSEYLMTSIPDSDLEKHCNN